jgi:hypothetical protein
VAGALVGWMVLYGRRARRAGERLAAQAEAAQAEAAQAEAAQMPEPVLSASR